jgi:hypothetical protein
VSVRSRAAATDDARHASLEGFGADNLDGLGLDLRRVHERDRLANEITAQNATKCIEHLG